MIRNETPNYSWVKSNVWGLIQDTVIVRFFGSELIMCSIDIMSIHLFKFYSNRKYEEKEDEAKADENHDDDVMNVLPTHVCFSFRFLHSDIGA